MAKIIGRVLLWVQGQAWVCRFAVDYLSHRLVEDIDTSREDKITEGLFVTVQ